MEISEHGFKTPAYSEAADGVFKVIADNNAAAETALDALAAQLTDTETEAE